MPCHRLISTSLLFLAISAALPGAETVPKEGVLENRAARPGSVLFSLPLDDANPLPGLRAEVTQPDAANAQAGWHPSLGTIREQGSPTRSCYSQPNLGAPPALR